MIQNKKEEQHNRSLECISRVILPFRADLGETLNGSCRSIVYELFSTYN